MARKHEQERNEAIKKMIVDAALKICIEDGYKEVTVRRIGDMIGYSTGVIYYHFKDKQDIINCLDLRLDEEAYNTVSSLIDPANTLRENLTALYEYTCNLAYNNYEMYRRIFAVSRIEAADYTRRTWLKMFTECLTAAANNGEIKNENIELRAKCLLSYVIGYNLLYLEIDKTDYETALAEKDTVVDVIINGIINK